MIHNGARVIDNVAFDHPTGSAMGTPYRSRGPIRLQDHGAAVRYRNIWLKTLDETGSDSMSP